MFYKLFINYIRLSLFRKIFTRFMSKNAARGGKLSKMSIVPFVAELALTYLLDKKGKGKTLKKGLKK
ncbi:MAG: hypothetical protein H0T84_11905 [Tatlockia sp.]|nr:hypothetical protein [Tatlockia sp.]